MRRMKRQCDGHRSDSEHSCGQASGPSQLFILSQLCCSNIIDQDGSESRRKTVSIELPCQSEVGTALKGSRLGMEEVMVSPVTCEDTVCLLMQRIVNVSFHHRDSATSTTMTAAMTTPSSCRAASLRLCSARSGVRMPIASRMFTISMMNSGENSW